MAPWNIDYVVKNKFSRPGTKNDGVKGIVMHWTATPGASDTNEQKFFDGSDGGGGRYASAHLFVDRDSATLILPLNEVGYHANDHACRVDFLKPNANFTSIGIEICVEKDGTIHAETVERAAQVAAELCRLYKLDPLTKIVRHFDVTGKNCPAPWVADSSKFTAFKKRVDVLIKPAAPKPTPKPAPKPVGKSKSHVVADNETFYSIAKEYGVSVADLQKFNPRVDPAKLHVGDVIYLYAVPAPVVKPAPKPVEVKKPAPAKPKYVIPTGVLKQGMSGAAVILLQKALNAANFDCGTPDGDFGGKTYDALKRFQSVYCNPADGVYGSKTAAALNKVLN